jgi:hypothetical protein
MVRCFLSLVFVFGALSDLCLACSCIGIKQPCEKLRSDVVFVGRVIETVALKHPLEKNSWTAGYSMRVAVEESIAGVLGSEVTIETGSGGGDCGTPLPPGERFLIFTYYDKDGKLWTGACMGNEGLTANPSDDKLVEQYRAWVRRGKGSIFGNVTFSKPIWREDDVESTATKPLTKVILHANSDRYSASTETRSDGSYEFEGLSKGNYTIVPDKIDGLDFDHEYEDNYRTDLHNGQCANINFSFQPSTRIRGHVVFPSGMKDHSIEVVAVPTHLKKLNQFSGKWDFTDENDRFDLWPLPPGDYYVGVNINSSPKADAPFPPTYFPGVANKTAASIVHIKEGGVKELELPLREVAKERIVHIVAIGLDGKPLQKIYVQLEDLRHPGDAASYVNVDLDASGKGTTTIYQGYSYHLHGSHWVSYQNDWCAKPVVIPAGTDPVEAHFIMDRKSGHCDIYDIDGLERQ